MKMCVIEFSSKFSKFEDSWHLTEHFWNWPKINKGQLIDRLREQEAFRMFGCARPNIAPCQNKWVVVKFYFRNREKPTISRVCMTSPKNEHWGHLFGWTSGWTRCEVIGQDGNIISEHK